MFRRFVVVAIELVGRFMFSYMIVSMGIIVVVIHVGVSVHVMVHVSVHVLVLLPVVMLESVISIGIVFVMMGEWFSMAIDVMWVFVNGLML
jgi:hypothetical protein